MRKLEEEIVTGLSRQAVWEVLADFGGVQKWAPGMRRSRLEGDSATGVGTRRVMRHRWGFRIAEVVTEWNEGSGYAFDLLQAPFPMENVHETWLLEHDAGGTRITTTVSYDMGVSPLGALLDALLVRFLVAREMRAGLRALIAYAERHSVVRELTRRAPVQPVREASTEQRISG
jgi:ligand-binding SRPBCC domain-containing protein